MVDHVVAKDASEVAVSDEVGEGAVVDLSSLMTESPATGINIYFPVTVEVREAGTLTDIDSLVERALDRLTESLDGE